MENQTTNKTSIANMTSSTPNLISLGDHKKRQVKRKTQNLRNPTETKQGEKKNSMQQATLLKTKTSSKFPHTTQARGKNATEFQKQPKPDDKCLPL
jgi:hypothetical protein